MKKRRERWGYDYKGFSEFLLYYVVYPVPHHQDIAGFVTAAAADAGNKVPQNAQTNKEILMQTRSYEYTERGSKKGHPLQPQMSNDADYMIGHSRYYYVSAPEELHRTMSNWMIPGTHEDDPHGGSN